MSSKPTHRFAVMARAALVIGAALLATVTSPGLSVAQITPEPVAYAVSELNLRKGPGNSDYIFAVVPLGAELTRAAGDVTNGYAPVSYNGINGWVVDLGLVATPEEVELANAAQAPSEAPLELFASDARVTLTPLMLRSAPDIAAEPITGMPEGSVVTLTQEGWDNGYVTVDYDGARGWAYADLLATPAEVEEQQAISDQP
jgi:uncharacterized protein YraI